MPNIPYELYSSDQVRQIEKFAIEELGIASYELMKRAGLAAFNVLTQHWPQARKLIICCGGGNNGGDGYVIARLAKTAGLQAEVCFLSDPKQLTNTAKQAYLACEKAEVKITAFNQNNLHSADLIIDALLGTGLKGHVKENYQTAITAINSSKKPVIAIDVPSGLNADTGYIHDCAVAANATITFIGLKQGLFTGSARNVCGQILCDDLQIPAEAFETIEPLGSRINFNNLQPYYLAPRARNAHKNCFGYALLIGGDHGMAGAVIMAGIACARTGAGLTTIATRPEHVVAVVSKEPALMAAGINKATDLVSLSNKASVIGLGPGLGQSNWSESFFQQIIITNKILVIDADGLNVLAKNKVSRTNWILTPHPGEAARLLACTTTEIENDRYAAVSQIQKEYGGVIILKGAGTIICDTKQNIFVCDAGNPGMASGGMGDVLTGIIVSLLAQRVPLADAAKLGVMLHAKAADLAAKELGERGLLALDLLPYLRKLIN